MSPEHAANWLALLHFVTSAKMDLSVRAYTDGYEVELYTLDVLHFEVSGPELGPLAADLVGTIEAHIKREQAEPAPEAGQA